MILVKTSNSWMTPNITGSVQSQTTFSISHDTIFCLHTLYSSQTDLSITTYMSTLPCLLSIAHPLPRMFSCNPQSSLFQGILYLIPQAPGKTRNILISTAYTTTYKLFYSYFLALYPLDFEQRTGAHYVSLNISLFLKLQSINVC